MLAYQYFDKEPQIFVTTIVKYIINSIYQVFIMFYYYCREITILDVIYQYLIVFENALIKCIFLNEYNLKEKCIFYSFFLDIGTMQKRRYISFFDPCKIICSFDKVIGAMPKEGISIFSLINKLWTKPNQFHSIYGHKLMILVNNIIYVFTMCCELGSIKFVAYHPLW